MGELDNMKPLLMTGISGGKGLVTKESSTGIIQLSFAKVGTIVRKIYVWLQASDMILVFISDSAVTERKLL